MTKHDGPVEVSIDKNGDSSAVCQPPPDLPQTICFASSYHQAGIPGFFNFLNFHKFVILVQNYHISVNSENYVRPKKVSAVTLRSHFFTSDLYTYGVAILFARWLGGGWPTTGHLKSLGLW
jgi:hypothetical protein